MDPEVARNHTSSPRPWGCFHVLASEAGAGDVFPTPVGVFLYKRLMSFPFLRLPHARGGVSVRRHCCPSTRPSSPRPWGCFVSIEGRAVSKDVFPTPVGVFPNQREYPGTRQGLPHARGGVSFCFLPCQHMPGSSPRPWGCFRGRPDVVGQGHVFPTPVGVFPRILWRSSATPRLPHARGGVSLINPPTPMLKASSPRPWGCFFLPACGSRPQKVFPTPVGVFLPCDRSHTA